MALTVYIETTIPSAYVSVRTDPGSVYRREATREWWREQLHLYEPWTSDNVLWSSGRESGQDSRRPLDLLNHCPGYWWTLR